MKVKFLIGEKATGLQLRNFVSYKAENLGKTTIHIYPKYTSQRCSKCGFIDKANRNGCPFHCLSCDFVCHSDLNASYNISQIGSILFEQVVFNQPIVAINEEISSLQKKSSISVTSHLL